MTIKTMTGAEFKAWFKPYVDGIKDTDTVTFGNGDLSFSRIKPMGPNTAPDTFNIQFAEPYELCQATPAPD